GISGIAVAAGPLIGGAVVQGFSWHWIFWINVPIGIALTPIAMRRLQESRGPYGTLDLPGLVLACSGAFGVVFALVRAQSLGWGSPTILATLLGGAALLAGFVAWERRAPEPMLPMEFFAKRSFAVTNIASLSMYFGMFGSIFFLSQFMQNVLHNTPFQAGLKLLVWTGATMLVAPFAGVFSERYGSRPFIVAGLTLQALALGLLAEMSAIDLSYGQMIVPFLMAGSGMALVFAPSASAVLSSVRPDQAGQASGATNAIRELGGVLGVAVLASVFTGSGSYDSPQAFVDGLTPALWTSVAVLGAGALTVLLLPFTTRAASASATEPLRADGECAEHVPINSAPTVALATREPV
ncbi:MAG TPA: MFS transporter, partial [Solirubrobacteraceae bacterium]|nr:MFS transporter [Solirubrobacteraceae bacterium]